MVHLGKPFFTLSAKLESEICKPHASDCGLKPSDCTFVFLYMLSFFFYEHQITEMEGNLGQANTTDYGLEPY